MSTGSSRNSIRYETSRYRFEETGGGEYGRFYRIKLVQPDIGYDNVSFGIEEYSVEQLFPSESGFYKQGRRQYTAKGSYYPPNADLKSILPFEVLRDDREVGLVYEFVHQITLNTDRKAERESIAVKLDLATFQGRLPGRSPNHGKPLEFAKSQYLSSCNNAVDVAEYYVQWRPIEGKKEKYKLLLLDEKLHPIEEITDRDLIDLVVKKYRPVISGLYLSKSSEANAGFRDLRSVIMRRERDLGELGFINDIFGDRPYVGEAYYDLYDSQMPLTDNGKVLYEHVKANKDSQFKDIKEQISR